MIIRPRLRDIGLVLGRLPTGPHNAITDVAGVCVGHSTLVAGEGPLVAGEGPIRTGVTAILPHAGNLFQDKVAAAVYRINGFGKAAGFEQVRELGVIETPIMLTNTLNVGSVADAVISYMLRDNPGIGVTTSTVNPVVGECNDGFLNDIQGRHVRAAHVFESIEAAQDGAVQEGNVGGGTGMQAFRFKGGIGTASRKLPEEYGGFSVGVLTQTNFGRREDLMIAGVPMGMRLRDSDQADKEDRGSIMMVLATDAPCSSRQLHRLAARAGFGLARTGSMAGHGSGDFVIAFSTTNRRSHTPANIVSNRPHLENEDGVISYLFQAVIESVEEAITNALFAAETMVGRDGHKLQAIPIDRVREIFEAEGRL